MTKDKLKTIVEENFEKGVVNMNKHGKIIPIFKICFTGNDGEDTSLVVGMGGDPGERQATLMKGLGVISGVLERTKKVKKVEAIIMVAEAFFVARPNPHYIGEIKDQPEKGELLIVAGMTADEEVEYKFKQIIPTEIKGKRYFTLEDFHRAEIDQRGVGDTVLLEYFMRGYRGLLKRDENGDVSERFSEKLKSMSVGEAFHDGLKVLIKELGGAEMRVEK